MTADAAPRGLMLFTGPDRARKLQRLDALVRAWRVDVLDRHQVDGPAADADLLRLCRQQPAASPVRFIVVDRADRLPKDVADALLAHAPALTACACVVLLVDGDLPARSPLAGAARRPVQIEAFPAREIPAAKPFALLDALGAGHVGAALEVVRDQFSGGREAVELFGLVSWQVQRWVAARRLLDAGTPPDRLGRTLGLGAWQTQRLCQEVRMRPLAALQRLLERCWELERDAKTGRLPPEAALETLVLEIGLGSAGAALSAAAGSSGT